MEIIIATIIGAFLGYMIDKQRLESKTKSAQYRVMETIKKIKKKQKLEPINFKNDEDLL